MKALPIFVLIFLMLPLGSCKNIDTSLLANNWVGESITMDREKVDGDVSKIRLLLREDGTFRYRDLNGLEKEGTYNSKLGILFLNPTEGEKESWEIVSLTSDRMTIKVEMGIRYFTLDLVGTQGD